MLSFIGVVFYWKQFLFKWFERKRYRFRHPFPLWIHHYLVCPLFWRGYLVLSSRINKNHTFSFIQNSPANVVVNVSTIFFVNVCMIRVSLLVSSQRAGRGCIDLELSLAVNAVS